MTSEYGVPINWDLVVETYRRRIYATLDSEPHYYIANITGKAATSKKKLLKKSKESVKVPNMDGATVRVLATQRDTAVISALLQDPRLRFGQFNGKAVITRSVSSMLGQYGPTPPVNAFGAPAVSADASFSSADDDSCDASQSEEYFNKASLQLWTNRILQHYSRTTDPFIAYRIVAEASKTKKVLHPPHISTKQHIKTLMKALNADPRFEVWKGYIHLVGKESPAVGNISPVGPRSGALYSSSTTEVDTGRLCTAEDLDMPPIPVTYAQRSNIQPGPRTEIFTTRAPATADASSAYDPATPAHDTTVVKEINDDEHTPEVYFNTLGGATFCGDRPRLDVAEDCGDASTSAVVVKGDYGSNSAVVNEPCGFTPASANPASGSSFQLPDGTPMQYESSTTCTISSVQFSERLVSGDDVKQQSVEPPPAPPATGASWDQTVDGLCSQTSELALNFGTANNQNADTDSLKSFFGDFYKERSVEDGIVPGTRYVLADRHHAQGLFREYALLGIAAMGPGKVHRNGNHPSPAARRSIFMNTHEPFCFVTVGVQGAGKSHTLGCVLESCLIPFPQQDVIHLQSPMSGLVLHYDQNVTSVCEATGVIAPSPLLARVLRTSQLSLPSICLPREKMVVLVSPSYYNQRLQFYGDYCIVKPLLFRWSSLTADHIKRIMRVKQSDNQLYMAVLLDLLRSYQRKGAIPSFNTFLATIKKMCEGTQSSPLLQRLSLLESLVFESDMNAHIAGASGDLVSGCSAGTLVIVDLTDPLLASDEANGIFQVLTEQFRSLHIPLHPGCGKVLVLDEAHKFMDGVATDGLSQSIVNMARLMRHDGMRLVVSTQCPKALAPELLELVSVAVLHKFHSNDWFRYLSTKLPLSEHAWNAISNFQSGQALVFSSQLCASELPYATQKADTLQSVDLGLNTFEIQIRPRITADRGETRKNDGRTTVL